jgi:hypothetical protein
MSWLRRLFRRDDLGREVREIVDRMQADERRRAREARPELLRLLTERGARSAIVVYDGGHDEGFVTAVQISREPLGVAPAKWTGPELSGAEELPDDTSMGGGQASVFDAAFDVVAGKWGGFAGEFVVKGRLVIDVESGEIARHDDVWIDEEPEDDEDWDEDADLEPKGPPTVHEVEPV